MRPRRTATGLVATLLALVLLPGVVAAHSELETSVPADGATLTAPPLEITGDFSEELDPSRSSMELRGPEGAPIASGGVLADGPPTRMAIVGLPALPPGVYEVRWTTVTADDDGVERGTFAFTVAAVGPSPEPSAPQDATPSTRPAETPGSPAASPTSPAPSSDSAPGTADLLIPLVVLGAVLVGGAALFLRRRR